MDRRELSDLSGREWDVVVVGGGVTGAGVFVRSARAGYRTLLVEGRDFSWGASSRSGKLVHGGLRYLAQGRVRTTWHSVRERERLLKVYRGLVQPLGFLMPVPKARKSARRILGFGLTAYDLMAGRWLHRFHDSLSFGLLAPAVSPARISGGYAFSDAVTDDSRLVWRLIQSGRRAGGTAVNYVAAVDLELDGAGRTAGLRVRDGITGRETAIGCRTVVNAAGAWCDRLRGALGKAPVIRRLRGSHLVFPGWRFPLAQAVSMFHPRDGRAVYALPWQGATLLGTTDLDDHTPEDGEPAAGREETGYLLEAANHWLPGLGLSHADASASFCGLRPVIASDPRRGGKPDPSRESRDHMVRSERNLITVTGGKLTTFGLMADQTLKIIRREIGPPERGDESPPAVERPAPPPPWAARLAGRYADRWPEVARGGEERIPGTDYLWSELEFSARHELIVRLEDLLLRRTRLGLILPRGGAGMLDAIGEKIRPALGWSRERWRQEAEDYLRVWRAAHAPPI